MLQPLMGICLRYSVLKQKIFTIFVLLLLLILWVCYAHYFNPPIFPLDDGYIYLHNAQVLHAGYDHSYPGVPALDGSTSPIYLLLIALLLFVVSPLWALQTAAWLGILVYSLGLLRLAFVHKTSAIQTALLLVIGLAIGIVPYHLLNGVETGWALAAVTWILVLLSAEQTLRTRILINILCGFLPFLRPELVVFSAVIILWQISNHYRSAKNFKLFILNVIGDWVLVLIAVAPWVLWYWLSTGQPYPMTISAKNTFIAQNCLPWHLHTVLFVRYFFWFIALLGTLNFLGMFILLSFTALGRVVLIAFVALLIFFWLYMPQVIMFNNLRYLQPLIPLLLYGFVTCLRHECEAIRWLANSLLVLAAVCAVVGFPVNWRVYLEDAHTMTAKVIAVANWCNKNLPAHAVILVHDAGYMSLATPFRLIDLVGLKTPEAIHYQRQYTLASCGLQRYAATAAIVHHYHPDYMITLPDWEEGFGIMRHADQLGWSAKLLYKTPGSEGYKVYKVAEE